LVDKNQKLYGTELFSIIFHKILEWRDGIGISFSPLKKGRGLASKSVVLLVFPRMGVYRYLCSTIIGRKLYVSKSVNRRTTTAWFFSSYLSGE
jgi:hypothetical protein